MSKERFKMIAEVSLFLIKNGKVLLLRRYNTGFEDGNYHVIAGHVDGNEEIRHAAIREAQEEANIDVRIDDLEVVHVMHRRNAQGQERMAFFLVAHQWTGELKNNELDKCDEFLWCDLNALPANTVEYLAKGLNNYMNGVHYDSFGWD